MSGSGHVSSPGTPRGEIEAAWARLQQLGPSLDAYHRGVGAALAWLRGAGPLPFADRFTHNPPDNPDHPGQRVRVGLTVAEVYYDVRMDAEVRQYALGAEHVINGVVGGVSELPPYR